MRTATEHTYRGRLLRVLLHIQDHLNEELSLDELARVAAFSPYHFHRIFKGMVGEGVKEHVRRLRLERAAQRLKSGAEAIIDLAFEAGYESHEAFTRAFQSRFGVAPSAYRKAHEPLPAAPSRVHFTSTENFSPINTGGSSMEVRFEQLQPMRVAFVRHIGPFHEIGPVWQRFAAWAGPRGLFGPATKCLSLWWDDPEVTPEDKLRCDACLTVRPSFQPEGEVGVQEIAGGEYAVTRHRGPYSELTGVYLRFFGEWLPASGRELRPLPSFEVYLNSPQTSKPEDLLTDIYMPVQ